MTNIFNKKKEIDRAKAYLRYFDKTFEKKKFKDDLTTDQIDEGDILELAKSFRQKGIFSYARRLYQLLYNEYSLTDKEIQNLAVCTYKDMDLPSETKYDTAANLLIENFKIKNGPIQNALILGTLGSIYKKKWKYENFDGHLYKALRYYLQGYEIAKETNLPSSFADMGFCGINLAFTYDLLSSLDYYQIETSSEGLSFSNEEDPFHKQANDFKNLARKYRIEISNAYAAAFQTYQEEWIANPEKKIIFEQGERYWFFVTWAEACIGLGKEEIKIAKEKFKAAVTTKETNFLPTTWQRHSASIQGFELIDILYKDKKINQLAKEAVRELFNNEKVAGNHTDKIGLALSGGGFRASIYHIGMLAKLAEADLLRKVEVISCVSGGSIVGAYYYLMLKKELENNVDSNSPIEKNKYIELVKKLEKKFIEDVNKNVRMHILSNFFKNIRMSFSKNFNRTRRTAELYDEYFYNKWKGKDDTSNVLMKNLRINPLEINEEGNKKNNSNFNPVRDNWKRNNKVPILVLNATTLNTGHAWQFTATWMGESPAFIGSEFDALPTLRRMYYDEAPKNHENIPLSMAVAASAGVPGLFDPIELDNLYEGVPKVSLIDGGVHDNQGLSSLYEQECNLLIISDASGQMPAELNPTNSIIGVVGRTNTILQDRVRYSQFKDLQSRKKSGVIQDFILMHFTKNLSGKAVDWTDCNDPKLIPSIKPKKSQSFFEKIDIGIRENIQKLLAKIRTDLDAFHETESSTLMYSAYQMTAAEIKTSSFFSKNINSSNTEVKPKFNFLAIAKIKQDDNNTWKEVERILTPSSKLFGKAFTLSKFRRKAVIILIALIFVGSIWLRLTNEDFATQIYLFIKENYLLFLSSGFILFLHVVNRYIWKKSIISAILSIIFSILLAIFIIPLGILSWLMEKISTPWYLRLGRLPKKN